MAPPTDLQDLRDVMNNLGTGSSPISIPATLPRTLEMLKILATSVGSIELFAHFYSTTYLIEFRSDIRPPLSPGETFRVRRALLRFQLYTQLFQKPEATDEIVSDRD